jgi:hypothetical protein
MPQGMPGQTPAAKTPQGRVGLNDGNPAIFKMRLNDLVVPPTITPLDAAHCDSKARQRRQNPLFRPEQMDGFFFVFRSKIFHSEYPRHHRGLIHETMERQIPPQIRSGLE